MTYLASPERYTTMHFARCGRSGLLLPRVSLGLWHNFGDEEPAANARALLLRAFDLGITHFDLANNYGPPPGSAEATLGRVLRSDLGAHRDELIVSTKAGYDMWAGPYGDHGSRKYLLSSLDQSLRRLGLDYVDIFYHHRPDPETPLEETMGALASAVHAGKALYVGISNYDAARTREAAALLRQLGAPCLIHQPRYNLLERWVEPDLLSTLAEEGIGCIPFSPLAQGLLTARYLTSIPADSRAARPGQFFTPAAITEERRRLLVALDEVARARGQSLAQLALTWVLRRPEVTSVLVGASRPSQLDDCVGVVSAPPLAAEELSRIDALVAG